LTLEAAILSFIIATLRRGRIMRFAELKIEHLWLVFVPAVLILAPWIAKAHVPRDIWMPLTGWLHVAANAAFLLFFWANLRLPGMRWFLVGWILNVLPIAANGGKMPVSAWAANTAHAGIFKGVMARHVEMSSHTHFNWLSDIIPLPRPPAIIPAAMSIGDVLMAVGIFILIQMIMCPGGHNREPVGAG
jgi:hypothetical protein